MQHKEQETEQAGNMSVRQTRQTCRYVDEIKTRRGEDHVAIGVGIERGVGGEIGGIGAIVGGGAAVARSGTCELICWVVCSKSIAALAQRNRSRA